VLFIQLHDLLTCIETLYVEEKFYGSSERFFKILTSCARDRPVSKAVFYIVTFEFKNSLKIRNLYFKFTIH